MLPTPMMEQEDGNGRLRMGMSWRIIEGLQLGLVQDCLKALKVQDTLCIELTESRGVMVPLALPPARSLLQLLR